MRNWFLLVLLVFPLWAHAQSSPSIGAGDIACNPTAALGPMIGCSNLPSAFPIPFLNITTSTNTQATMTLGTGGSIVAASGGSVYATGTGIINATEVNSAPVSPVSVLTAGGVCDGVTDNGAAINTLVAAGAHSILLPAGCVAYIGSSPAVLAKVPDNTIIYGEGATSMLIASPTSGNMNVGAWAAVKNLAMESSFCTAATQPQTVPKACFARGMYNQNSMTFNGVLHTWNGEEAVKMGTNTSPYGLTPPVRSVGFTQNSSSSLTLNSLNPLTGDGIYSFTFSDGEQRRVSVTGTAATVQGTVLSGSGMKTATLDDVSFAANATNTTTGTLSFCMQAAPGNTPNWTFIFDEGGGVTETRTDISITLNAPATSGTCTGALGGVWTTGSALASGKTIYGASVVSTDLPSASWVCTGTGDCTYQGCDPQFTGQGNCIRQVIDAQGPTPGSSVGVGIFQLLGQNSPTYSHHGFYVRDFQDGSLSNQAQSTFYVDRRGQTIGGGSTFYVDDAATAVTAGISSAVMEMNLDVQTTAPFILLQSSNNAGDTLNFSSAFIKINADPLGLGLFAGGKFLDFFNAGTEEYWVDANGEPHGLAGAAFTGTISLNANAGTSQTNLCTGTTTGACNVGGGSGSVNLKGTVNINTTTNLVTHIADGGSTSAVDIGSGTNLTNVGPLVSSGTTFTATVSGCSTTSGTPDTYIGGAQAGTFKAESVGTGCVIVITPNGAGGASPQHAWVCLVTDMSTAQILPQTATALGPPATCTVTSAGTLAAGNTFSFMAIGY